MTRFSRAVIGITFLFWGLMAGAAHYSFIDDLQWGVHVGVRWWLQGLLNTRYVGNFFAVLLCHSSLARIVIMWFTMFLIPFLMACLAVRDGKGTSSPSFLPAFLLSNAAVLLMPRPIWREVYGWVSGFGNYAMSVLFFLLWLTALRHVEHTRRRPGLWAAILFVLTLVMGLFLENLTLLFLGASLILAIWAIWDRSLCVPFWACLAGAAAALYLMFFTSMILQLLQEGVSLGGRRGLTFTVHDSPLTILISVLWRYVGYLLPMAFCHGCHIALPLAVITGCAFWRSPLRKLWVLSLLPLGYGCYIWTGHSANTLPAAFVSCLCWAVPFLALLLQTDGLRDKIGRILLYLSAPLSLAPISAAGILGERFYFFPLILTALVATDEAAPLLAMPRRAGQLAAGALTILLMIPWVWRGSHVLACNLLCWSLTNQARAEGGHALTLPADRYDNLWWYPRLPNSAEGAHNFALRFKLADDLTLTVLPPGSFETWPDIPQELWDRRQELHADEPFVSAMP